MTLSDAADGQPSDERDGDICPSNPRNKMLDRNENTREEPAMLSKAQLDEIIDHTSSVVYVRQYLLERVQKQREIGKRTRLRASDVLQDASRELASSSFQRFGTERDRITGGPSPCGVQTACVSWGIISSARTPCHASQVKPGPR